MVTTITKGDTQFHSASHHEKKKREERSKKARQRAQERLAKAEGTAESPEIPTNVVDDVVLIEDTKTGNDVKLSVDENGNVILFRATDAPGRIIDSDFPMHKKLPYADVGSRGYGHQTYFATNPTYSFNYELDENTTSSWGPKQNYKFTTNIKVNEILPLQQQISDAPELAKALGIPKKYWDWRWNNVIGSPKFLEEMGYSDMPKRQWLQDNIDIFKENGIKAFGNDTTGRGHFNSPYMEYEIIPLIKDGDTYDIKAISRLENRFSAKPPERELEFEETLLDDKAPEVKGNQVTNEDLSKAIDNTLFDMGTFTPKRTIVDHSTFLVGLNDELENMGYKSEVVESSLDKWLDINADTDFFKYEFSWHDVPEANLPETTPEVKAQTLQTDSKSTDPLGKQLSAKTAVFSEGEYAGRSIEDVWQNTVKNKRTPGTSGKSGKPDGSGLIKPGNMQDSYDAYDDLWKQWFNQNPDIYEQAVAKRKEGYTFVDTFGKKGNVRQDETIMRIIDSDWKPETTPEVKGVTQVDHFWNRPEVAKDTGYTYLFGDNTHDRTETKYIPTETQAVIRGLPNAVGIDTRISRTEDWTDTDDNYKKFTEHVDEQIQKAIDMGKPIKVSSGGMGTGKADLPPRFKEYLDNAINNIEIPEIEGETSEVKTGVQVDDRTGIKYSMVPEGEYHSQHYVNRNLYNGKETDLTLDFSKVSKGTGAGHTKTGAGDKWTWVQIDDTGNIDKSVDIDKIAQKLSDVLTSGQKVNIAGHGLYESGRGGFSSKREQSVIDDIVRQVFNRAKELSGNKPWTGEVWSGGQSGYDEAGIRVAMEMGLPAQVNVTEWVYRPGDAAGYKDDIYGEEEFFARFEDTPKGLSKGPGTAAIDDPAFKQAVSETAKSTDMPESAIKVMGMKFGVKALKVLSVLRFVEPVEEAVEYLIEQKLGYKGFGLLWAKAEIYNLFMHNVFSQGVAMTKPKMAQTMLIAEAVGIIDEEELPPYFENVEEDMWDIYQKYVKNWHKTSAWMHIDNLVRKVNPIFKDTGQAESIALAGIKGYDWIKNMFGQEEKYEKVYGGK